MKKILALITAFFMSLSTSTDYTVVSEKPYSGDTYTIADTMMPDYRAYFSGGEGVSSATGCRTANFNSNAKSVGFGMGYWFCDSYTPAEVDADKNIFKADLYIYDKKGKLKETKQVSANKKVTDGDHKYTDAYVLSGMFKQNQYIVAPFKCTLESRSISGSVTDMKLLCDVGANTYRIRIHNMKCWYCDINRTGDFTFHTSDEQSGKTFSAGNVLGVASPNTYIEIHPVDSNGTSIGHCSMTQFYRGTYTPFKTKKGAK